jgi:hypothetical protein
MTTHDSDTARELLSEIRVLAQSPNRDRSSPAPSHHDRWNVASLSDLAQTHATLEVAHQLGRIADVLTYSRLPSAWEREHDVRPDPMLIEALQGLVNIGDTIESAIIRGTNR